MSSVNHSAEIIQYTEPFNYFIVENFLNVEIYNKLETYHQKLLKHAPLSENPTHTGFSKMDVVYHNHGKHVFSPYSYPVFMQQTFPGTLVYGAEFYNFVQKLFHWIPFTPDVYSSLRHNPINLTEDCTHTDYCSVYFHEKKQNELFRVAPAEKPDPQSFRVARAVTTIFYLNNPDWKSEDGGGTGIYKTKELNSLAREVEPFNNRLLLFEISPNSYHRFIRNQKPRNAIVTTFHTSVDFLTERYKIEPKVHWLYGT